MTKLKLGTKRSSLSKLMLLHTRSAAQVMWSTLPFIQVWWWQWQSQGGSSLLQVRSVVCREWGEGRVVKGVVVRSSTRSVFGCGHYFFTERSKYHALGNYLFDNTIQLLVLQYLIAILTLVTFCDMLIGNIETILSPRLQFRPWPPHRVMANYSMYKCCLVRCASLWTELPFFFLIFQYISFQIIFCRAIYSVVFVWFLTRKRSYMLMVL